MLTVGYVFVGAFALVFVGFPAALLLADRYSDSVHEWIVRRARRVKRDLAARWLAEEGLTVRPLTQTETALAPVRTVGVDELVTLINEW